MNAYLVSIYFSRSRGSWHENYVVFAETEEDAIEKVKESPDLGYEKGSMVDATLIDPQGSTLVYDSSWS